MTTFMSNILPTLDSLGVWSYWIVALAAFLEGLWITGVVVPGTLVVDAGGALVRLGHLDFFDLVWFVAVGAILGGEAGWHSARWLGSRFALPEGRAFRRAQELVRAHGPVALLLGRFLGPVAGLAALAAALSGMDRRRFHIWNFVSGVVYAHVHIGIGYLAGDITARLLPYLPRLALPIVVIGVLILATWFVIRQARKGMPVLVSGMKLLGTHISHWPPAIRLARRHPRTTRFLSRRLDPSHGGGLLATGVVLLLVYLIGVFFDGALDLAMVPDTVALDARVSNLAHAYWTPTGLQIAGWITEAGHVPVATLIAVGGVLGFAFFGRRAAAIGLAVAVVGDAVTVTLLKLAFGRARPEISYFLESSHSFPSGHAAISVALYGSLAVMLWRERLIGPTMAIWSGVGIAFTLGFTRIYLVEHFLSDVLNGWVIGAIWLVIGFAVAEALRPRPVRPMPFGPVLGIAATSICLLAAIWVAVRHHPTPMERTATGPSIIRNLQDDIDAGHFQLEVVTLSGDELPAVSIISTGAQLEKIDALLVAGGWTDVPRPGLISGMAAVRQDLTDKPRPGATAPVAFLSARPADATLRAPEQDAIVRLWQAGQDGNGAPVVAWAFAAERDDGNAALTSARTAALSLIGKQTGGAEIRPGQPVLVNF